MKGGKEEGREGRGGKNDERQEGRGGQWKRKAR